MKKLFAYCTLLICSILLFSNSSYVIPDLEILRKKVIAGYMEQGVNENRIKDLMESVKEDGSWPDINYEDLSRTGFRHGEHLSNMVELSRAYRKQGSKFRNNHTLKKVIHASLDFWLNNDFICDNWWWNQIGTPDQMVKVLLIMDRDLSKDQITKASTIVGRANLDASGARPSGDRIKIAGILAKACLFSRDVAQFDEVINVIAGEIKFSTGRGMQYDYSFHHRVDRVTSTLSYGLGYADAFAEWASLVAGTKYSFPENTLDLLIDYYLDGICQTMVYGKYPDPGAENRSITREGNLNPLNSSTPEKLLQTSSYRNNELKKIVKIRKGIIRPDLTGDRFYWDSEYFSHQRPLFFSSVRMFSSRNHNMEEPYNSEGLLNHHFADGSNFISRTGDEYKDIFPVYDWQKIPGTTVIQKSSLPSENEIQKKGLTDFVGAVTDGYYSVVVFDFKSPHDPLEAKKAWFFFDKEYVCLGAGISSFSNLPVATTLNQCLLRGEAMFMSGNRTSLLSKGEHELKDVKWIIHDSVAYIFPAPVDLRVANQPATGSWYRINHQSDSPKDEISREVFKLWLDHGPKPENKTYQYIVFPSATIQEISRDPVRREIEILENSIEIQAVKHSGLNLYQIVFYRAGDIQISGDIKIGIDSPGLVMVMTDGQKIKKISVSDPSRKMSRIHVAVSEKILESGDDFEVTWDEATQSSNISIDLPQGVYEGKSVTLFFGR